MTKSIAAVGMSLATSAVESQHFSSKSSLLDFDIVLFKPDISEFLNEPGERLYNGKRCLDDNTSFELKESCEHWRREIKEALNDGKTVVIFLSELVEIFVDTGKREHSGTGRNSKETRIVDLYSNYKSLPISEKIVATTGTSMRTAPHASGALAQYWSSYQSQSRYRVTFPDAKNVCIETKSGQKPVGLMYTNTVSGGTLLMLPDIDFKRKDFLTASGSAFTRKAQEFAGHFLQQIISLDRALRSASEVTPEPTWLSDPHYMTRAESEIRERLLLAEAEVAEAQRRKEAVESELQSACKLKRLVYENGKALEEAIILALEVLGYRANSFDDGKSEFDVVFESDEGRLIGEAEGKDSKAVNIDKLRQLSMNIHEDLQRETVSVPAKGVLFGNGYRLIKPSERATQFTEKCVTAAQSTGIGLVQTALLYKVAKYVSDSCDLAYAKQCREVLSSRVGLIEFPAVPEVEPDDDQFSVRIEGQS